MKRIKTWLVMCLSVLLLIGCGGGGDGADARVAGVGSGGTGSGKSYVAGVVTEVNGDVVVNGIHFDTTDADVRNINEPAIKLPPSVLQPGMMVEIDGTGIEERDGKRTAKAINVRIASQVLGRVLVVKGSELLVLGMKIQVTEHTHYDPATLPGGLADIAIHDVIEVHGFLDSTRVATLPMVVATRVTRRTQEADEALFFIQGLIEKLGGDEYQLVGLPFTWHITSEAEPSGLASGRSVVRLAFPAWIVNKAVFPSLEDLTANVKVTLPTLEGGQNVQFDAFLDGVVTALDPENEQRFWLSNVEVNARRVPHLACVGLMKGDRVRLRGVVIRDQVHATKVEVLDKAAQNVSAEIPTPPLGCQPPVRLSEEDGPAVGS